MNLSELLGESEGAVHDMMDIKGLTADSRHVEPGFMFAALPGTGKTDMAPYIADAVRRGAVAILTKSGDGLKFDISETVRLITDDNPRRRFALLAAQFFGHQPSTVTAVTGTNGKTSVCSFTRQIWTRLGHNSASMGTLGVIAPDHVVPGGLTTPDPATLHKTLADLDQRGVSHVALEASSHGLDQYRIDGVRLAAAAFTNFTHDHLDYHGSMEAYLASKRRLFSEVLPSGTTAVLNADDPAFESLVQSCTTAGVRVWGYGDRGRDIRIVLTEPTSNGQNLALRVLGHEYRVALPLVGRFQAMNALCALGLVLATGATSGDAATSVEALNHLQGVPGRLERVAQRSNGAAIYVDYAHTPDALQTVLRALRPHTRNRLSVVFGCGGDRDRSKRPEMGALAAQYADSIIITDDNPRTEDPAAIRRAILTQCPKAREIGDRFDAIFIAVGELAEGDVLVIAGKGHERGQIVGDKSLPFDDTIAARRVADELDEMDRREFS